MRLRAGPRVSLSSESDSLFNLVFLLSGQTTWRIGEHSGELEAGGALFVAPGETLSVTGINVSFITLALESFFLLDAAVRARITKTEAQLYFRTSSVERDERLMQLVHALADELNDEQAAGRDLSVAAIIEQVIIHLLRRYMSVRRTSDLEMSRVGLVDRRIRRAIELMHANMEREISVGELAAAAYLSPFHFARLFKKLMGASPHAYLARLRVRRAQILLAETDLSVTEVAARVGYNNSSHFAKSFRQATALTPREFRRAVVRT